ncbi:MAG: tRNA (N(6)-L-threonylcarbamoyladenosine(37)-C(2))-methylthiotransferase MtaB [Chlorobiales bacterium]|nr:tRNA (N(6)-L-threonylcarbamoyladenosine(37)-C(2))-methylthiotransferase MtaB [Chlorobiales bacterium]
MKKITTYTLGCKLNYSETAAIAEAFLKQGYELVPFGEKADVTIINTCSVTENANQKCRQAVRKALKKSPESYVAVLGCYAQLEPEALASIHGVDAVLGAKEKFQIAECLGSELIKTGEAKIFVTDIGAVDNFGLGHSIALEGAPKDRTRAYLKVQDGCDYICSFCTIPLARGASRSLPIEKVIEQARMLADAGYQEIVLTGVNIGDYGINICAKFFDLVKALDTLDVPRIRISSIEPNLLSSDLIDLIVGSRRVVPHFHIPMQSGSDNILKAMRRRYSTMLYRERVEEAVSKIRDCAVGADVIVGFPGETAELFEETYRFIESLPVAYLHVFTFSRRPNTHADEMIRKNIWKPVPPQEVQERSHRLHMLSHEKKKVFASRYLETEVDVLFEGDFSDEEEHLNGKQICYGHTRNYLSVAVAVPSKEWAEVHLVGKCRTVRLSSLDEDLNAHGYIVEAPVLSNNLNV